MDALPTPTAPPAVSQLIILDSGCNQPDDPVHSGRVFRALSDGSRIEAIVHGQSLPETVAVHHGGQRLYWTAMGFPGAPDGAIWSANFDGSDARCVVAAGGPLNTPKQLVIDERRRLMYIADREGLKIVRCRLDGSALQTLVSTGDASDPAQAADGTRWCVGLAIDWEREMMYWTQKGGSKASKGRILRAPLDLPPGHCAASRPDIETLMEALPEPVNLAIDPRTRRMYWTDRGDVPHGQSLNRCRLDDLGGPTPLSVHPLRRTPYDCLVRNLHEPIGLKLDLDHDCLYLADMGGTVYQFDLDGRRRRKMYDDLEACYSGVTVLPSPVVARPLRARL